MCCYIKMVKIRLVSRDAKQLKKHYNNMIKKMGSSFTLSRDTDAQDSLVNTSSNAAATGYPKTVSGDFQRIVNMKELSRLGLTGSGNGKFYGKSSDTFQTDDIILVSSERWQFRKRIEDDEWAGYGIANVWLLVLLDG